MTTIKNIGLILAASVFVGQAAMASSISASSTEEVKEEIAAEDVKEGKSEEELAKQLANPIAALISVPFQFNYDRGFENTSGNESNKWTLNVQPVIPFGLNDDWNLISRTIVPIVRTDNNPLGSGINSNVGDVVQSLWLSPQKPTDSGWIWGAGPVFLIPSGSDISANTRGVGPTTVGLKQNGPWSYGGLINHVWSTGGDFDISATYLQPFVSYTTKGAVTVALNTESTYDWESEQWTVPLYLGATKVMKIGNQMISVGGGARYWAESSDGGAKGWGARINVILLFPR